MLSKRFLRYACVLGCSVLLAATALVAPAAGPQPRAAAAGKTTPADATTGAGGGKGELKTYTSAYYTIYSDIDPDEVKEATLRMTRMAEEYHERTAAFSGVIRQKFPFYLYRKPADYYAAGAPAGTAGVFIVENGDAKLMAIAGDKQNRWTWHVVQHEGFHQFAHAVIGGELPVWINEGLAEYFGEGMWTGDGFVTGLIPAGRLERIQDEITKKKFKSIQDMMLMTHAQWNAAMATLNYDQAWSMAHFLAHGDNGAYQKAFGQFMIDIGKNQPWEKAWEQNFGSADGFEQKWRTWWLAQKPNATAEGYARATISILVSFQCRAASQKQTFTTFSDFMDTARKGELKIAAEDWLPPSLLEGAVGTVDHNKGVKWGFDPAPSGASAPPQIACTLGDNTRVIGTYTGKLGRGGKVVIDIDDFAPTLEKAKIALADGKKDEAKTLIQGALKKHPKSALAEEARKLLVQTR